MSNNNGTLQVPTAYTFVIVFHSIIYSGQHSIVQSEKMAFTKIRACSFSSIFEVQILDLISFT